MHPLLKAEVQWGTPEEREEERLKLKRAGLLEAGLDSSVAICDGTKDKGHRSGKFGHKHEPDFNQKGNGRNHLLVRASLCISCPLLLSHSLPS